MFRKNYQYKRLTKCLIRKLKNNPAEFFKCLKSWRHYILCKGYEKETITTKDFKYKPTKKITMGGEWVKIRNNIMITYFKLTKRSFNSARGETRTSKSSAVNPVGQLHARPFPRSFLNEISTFLFFIISPPQEMRFVFRHILR